MASAVATWGTHARTFREAAERATRKRRRLTHSELDLFLAIITCEANDLQACGTSASMRAHGRQTFHRLCNPLLTVLRPQQLSSRGKVRRRLASWIRNLRGWPLSLRISDVWLCNLTH